MLLQFDLQIFKILLQTLHHLHDYFLKSQQNYRECSRRWFRVEVVEAIGNEGIFLEQVVRDLTFSNVIF